MKGLVIHVATTFAVSGETEGVNDGGTVMYGGNIPVGETRQSLAVGRADGTPDAGQNLAGAANTQSFGAVSGSTLPGDAQVMFLSGNSDVDDVQLGKDDLRATIHDIDHVRIDATTIQVLSSGTVGGVGDVIFTTVAPNAEFADAAGSIGDADDNEANVNRTNQGEFAIHEGRTGTVTERDYPSKTQ